MIPENVTLSNGVSMPRLGFGTYKIPDGNDVEQAVLAALEAGYRSIDTAEMYGNEKGIGAAVKRSGLRRGDIFIATKVWNTNHGYEETLRAFDQSVKNLATDYVDLYLIHWPVPGKYIETWRALERIYQDGGARSIGVSNFTIRHIAELLDRCSVAPAVNQVEFHPLLYQHELLLYCRKSCIQVEAWRPLVRGEISDIPLLRELALKYAKTPAQITLRWLLQLDIVVIPKSVRKERMIENAEIFDFDLTAEDMERIASLNQNRRLGPDPDNFSF